MASNSTDLFKVDSDEDISNTQIVVTGTTKTVIVTTSKRVVRIALD